MARPKRAAVPVVPATSSLLHAERTKIQQALLNARLELEARDAQCQQAVEDVYELVYELGRAGVHLRLDREVVYALPTEYQATVDDDGVHFDDGGVHFDKTGVRIYTTSAHIGITVGWRNDQVTYLVSQSQSQHIEAAFTLLDNVRAWLVPIVAAIEHNPPPVLGEPPPPPVATRTRAISLDP